MRIQIVGDHAPLRRGRDGVEQGLQEGDVVLLRAGLADAGAHLAARHVESRDQRLHAVTNVGFFLKSARPSRVRCQRRCRA